MKRVTTNVAWSSWKPFSGSTVRNPRTLRCMTSDKKTLLTEENASAKRNLISVGSCVDTPVDVDAAGNADRNRPCLGNGQTVLMRTPTQTEFLECWSEAIIEYQERSCKDFGKASRGKDLSKMKTQYERFVETVGSKKVTV